MTSHPLNSWHHTHCIWDNIHSSYDITATVYMTRHLLCSWHLSQYIWHLTWFMNDNTTPVFDVMAHTMTSYALYMMSLCVPMTSYALYMMSHTLCVWQHKLYIWLENPFYLAYKTSHRHFMTSNHRFYVITPIIFDIVSTATGCMTSYELHPLFMISEHCMTSHPLYSFGLFVGGREWQATTVFLPWESYEQYERQKGMILKDELPRSVGAQYVTEEIDTERMKRWRQHRNSTQVWMWLVVGVKSDVIKNSIA